MSDFSTDRHVCLCCGQRYGRTSVRRMSVERMEKALAHFEVMGLSRAELLGKHREQLEYQAPGFVEWLENVSAGGHPH